MTPCTICSQPTPGTDDDDAPCCDACDAANFGEAEVRPLARRDEQGRLRLVRAPLDGAPGQAWLREVLADEGGREA